MHLSGAPFFLSVPIADSDGIISAAFYRKYAVKEYYLTKCEIFLIYR